MRLAIIGILMGIAIPATAVFAADAAPDNSIPVASQAREWSDSTGRFHTEAILLDGDASHVRLQKLHGSIITVPLERLSEKDREFVLAVLRSADGKRADAPQTVTTLKPIIDRNAARRVAQSSRGNGHGADEDSTGLFADLKSGWSALSLPSLGETGALAKAGPLFAQSNVPMSENFIYVRLSRSFVDRTVSQTIAQSKPVDDTILGYHVAGRSSTTGSTNFELVPSEQSGSAVLRIFGTTNYSTVADAGPVQVYTTGTTQFASAKAFRFDGQGIETGPAVTNAQTTSRVAGVSSSLPGLRGRIARRIGERRAEESRAEAAAITAQHTATRVNRDMDRSSAERIAEFYQTVNTQLAALPADHFLRHCSWRVSSTKDALQLVVFAPSSDKYREVPAPTPLAAGADVEVQLHVGIVRFAMTDGDLQKLLRPMTVRIASNGESTARSSPLGKPAIEWSADREWLSLIWPNKSPEPQPEKPRKQRAPTLASESP